MSYNDAKKKYAKIGVDTEKVIRDLGKIAISLHCWQGDDVTGFETSGGASGGIQTTGNYPGRARTFEELTNDLAFTFGDGAGIRLTCGIAADDPVKTYGIYDVKWATPIATTSANATIPVAFDGERPERDEAVGVVTVRDRATADALVGRFAWSKTENLKGSRVTFAVRDNDDDTATVVATVERQGLIRPRPMSVFSLLCAAAMFAPHFEPAPAQLSVASNTVVSLDAKQTVSVACADASAEACEWAERHLKEWFGTAPKVVPEAFDGATLADEGYELEAAPEGVKVRAQTLQGVRYALYTLRQAAMPARGTLTVRSYVMPGLKVADAPKLDFRGVHICWSIESEETEIEKLVRLAAYYKFNYAVLEPWGAYRSVKYPWWGFKEGRMTPQAVRRIVALGRDLGLTLIPQINIFGHGSLSRLQPAKHGVIDAHPEYQTLFEPVAGWNWCLSNPETLKVQKGLADEMLELFGNPKYFHLGCDEAGEPSCPDCATSEYDKLVVGHIRAMRDHLAARGVRAMIWHDMFLKKGDPRWKGFYANGSDETVKALESFPRDLVICDWFYENPPKTPGYPTLRHFRDMGFTVLTCPWDQPAGTLAQGRFAVDNGLGGILVTIWHHGYGKRLWDIYSAGAHAGWGTVPTKSPKWMFNFNLDFMTHLRHVQWDMKLDDYEASGTFRHPIPAKTELPD